METYMPAEFAVWPVFLEVRERGRSLFGEFPYGSMATVGSRGSVRKERFEPHAFDFAIKDETREINLLMDHSYGKPLGSKLRGSLTLESSAKAVTFRATLPPVELQPSWMRDAVLSTRSGLVGGISPGFTVPPLSVVPNAEVLIPEIGNPGVMIRSIRAAVLFEFSLVTRPVYKQTVIDLRAEDFTNFMAPALVAAETPPAARLEVAYRWL